MSEILPNSEERWEDMPLPNQEESWKKMNDLLDKEDRRRRVLPIWFWRFGLSALLLIGIVTGSYFLLSKRNNNRPVAETNSREIQNKEGGEHASSKKDPTKGTNLSENISVKKQEEKNNSEQEQVADKIQSDPLSATEKKKDIESNIISLRKPSLTAYKFSLSKAQTETAAGNKLLRQKVQFSKKQSLQTEAFLNDNNVAKKERGNNPSSQNSQPTDPPGGKESQKKGDNVEPVATTSIVDSTNTKDSAKIAAPVVSSKQKSKTKKRRLQFSAGIGLQQSLAFDGQQFSTSDSMGRKVGWFDYVPSVYMRLQKEKWFVQAEFNYRVPQLVKPFPFSQSTSYDSSNNLIHTERVSIQKLYYRQILLSINRFVLPNLSWGIGGSYNLLAGAVAEQQIDDKNIFNGSSWSSKNPTAIKGYTDSFLYRSTAGILLQTDYHWKRISLGLRYTRALQPFIKYTRPDGAVVDEKNQALQAVLRFRVF